MANLWTRLDYRTWFVPGAINNPCFPAMDNNIQCQACVNSCSTQAIKKTWGTIQIDPECCNFCGDCYAACPGDLIGIQGLDKLLVRIKRDREKGADTLHLFCDHHRSSDVSGSVRVPTYKYLSPEVLFWAAALGYQKVAIPDRKACSQCEDKCYDQITEMIEIVNNWLQPWNQSLLIMDAHKKEAEPARQMSRRELFAGLGWNVKREVKEIVMEEVETRLSSVLPRTEQGYMRRQTLKAMAIKLLPEPDNWQPEMGWAPHINAECTGCRICNKQCPNRAIVYENDGLLIKPWLCSGCNFCVTSCPMGYVALQSVSDHNDFFTSRRYKFASIES